MKKTEPKPLHATPAKDNITRPANFDDEWAEMSKRSIRTLMARRGIDSYAELADRLQKIGVITDSRKIYNKIQRGSFSHKFYLQVVKALNLTNANFDFDE